MAAVSRLHANSVGKHLLHASLVKSLIHAFLSLHRAFWYM